MAAPVSFVSFCERVLGITLTPAQRVLARVAIDRVEPRDLPQAERYIAAELFGPLDAIPNAARFVLALVKGARSGGSLVFCSYYSLWRAVTADLGALAPGELGVAVLVCPDLRLSRGNLRYVSGAIKASSLRSLLEAETSDSLTLRRHDGRRVTVEALPASRGGASLRGRSLVSACLDECSFFRDESTGAVNDGDLFKAVAPRVLPGGMVVLCSTAWGEAGLLHDEVSRNHGNPATSIAAIGRTELMHPAKAPEVERERQRDPTNAAREFDCEFMSMGAGSYFDAAAVAACVDPGRRGPLAPVSGLRCVASADFAFSADCSALTVVRVEGGQLVLADWLEVKPKRGEPLKPSEVVARFAAVAKAHGCKALVADQHYKESVREHLQAHGLGFVDAEPGLSGKLTSYGKAQAAIHEGRVVLPDLPRLAQMLRETSVRPLPGGGMSITHPRRQGRGHGDLAAALVLGLARASRMLRGAGELDRGWLGRRREMAGSSALASFGGASGGGALDRLEVHGSAVRVGTTRRTRSPLSGGGF